MTEHQFANTFMKQVEAKLWESIASECPDLYTTTGTTTTGSTLYDLKKALAEIEQNHPLPPLAALRMSLDEFREAIKDELETGMFKEGPEESYRVRYKLSRIEMTAANLGAHPPPEQPLQWGFGMVHCKEVTDHLGNPWVIVGSPRQIQQATRDPIALWVALAKAGKVEESQ